MYSLSKCEIITLRALTVIAKSRTPISSVAVARQLDIHKRYLERTLQQLVSAKIIRSQRGNSGGYTVAKPVTKISLLDILKATTPAKRTNTAAVLKKFRMTKLSKDVVQRVDDTLDRISLNQIMKNGVKPS